MKCEKRRLHAEVVRVSQWQYDVYVNYQAPGHEPIRWLHRGYVSERAVGESLKRNGWEELPSSQWQRLRDRRAEYGRELAA